MVINCNGKLLSLEEPIVMGIINLNQDSFYENSRTSSAEAVILKAKEMIAQGAEIIDIGGMSSRPGAEMISEKEEEERVLPMLEALVKEIPDCIISVDTIRAGIAEQCLQRGAAIINDISGFKFDEQLPAVCHKYNAPYILMHMQGNPENMQEDPSYKDVTLEVLDYFIKKVAHLRAEGVNDIILDPGFGFGKTITHNYTLLQKLRIFKILDLPILGGISRKSMITKVLNINPEEALNGSSALHMIALQKGVNILRVHDVKEAMEVIKLYNELSKVEDKC